MAAQGHTYPWQRLKCLEEHIETRREYFTKTFFDIDTQYVQHIGFMSNGLIVQVMDSASGEVAFTYVLGREFKRWLRGY